MKFKLKLTNFMMIRMSEGSKIPWYYGHAYYNYECDQEVFYLIPFNWIFKWLRKLKFYWYKLLFHRDWIDEKFNEMFKDRK